MNTSGVIREKPEILINARISGFFVRAGPIRAIAGRGNIGGSCFLATWSCPTWPLPRERCVRPRANCVRKERAADAIGFTALVQNSNVAVTIAIQAEIADRAPVHVVRPESGNRRALGLDSLGLMPSMCRSERRRP